MAARDIVTLENSFAPCLLRVLYPLALAIILVGMLLGIAQGVRIITRPPMTPPAAAQSGAQPGTPPGAMGQMQPPPGAMMGPRGMMGRGMMGPAMMERRRMMRGMRAANPAMAGSFVIIRTLVAGAILMMVVRILAEMALAVLRLPKA
jgi:hypothetical protein